MPGEQIILGGTNAFGVPITDAADFTVDGAEVATIHINTFTETTLGDDGVRFRGDESDDLVTGGAGADAIRGAAGYDLIDGGAGDDVLLGQAGNDQIFGGDGADLIFGGEGDDHIAGGLGDDFIFARQGEDTLYFTTGAGSDRVLGFGEGDTLVLDVGLTAEAVLAAAESTARGTLLDFGDGDSLLLIGTGSLDLDGILTI